MEFGEVRDAEPGAAGQVAAVFPRMRWAGLVWLAVWIPAYWGVWGWQNFLYLCDIAVVLTCIGLWRGSALLLSSQAVSAIVINLVWCADVLWRLALGRHLVGGTEYMWDARFPLAVRLLSLFHFFWPVLQIWSLRQVGYDRRGCALQSCIAAVVMAVTRLIAPAVNINNVYRDPIFGRAWGPPGVHVALTWVGLVLLIYWPTHRVLRKTLRAT